MYLHLGAGVVIGGSEIVGIFDLDRLGGDRAALEFLHSAERSGVLYKIDDDLPKAAVLCADCVYLTRIAAATLCRRWKTAGL